MCIRDSTYVVLVPEGDTATQQKLSDALHAIPEVTGIQMCIRDSN